MLYTVLHKADQRYEIPFPGGLLAAGPAHLIALKTVRRAVALLKRENKATQQCSIILFYFSSIKENFFFFVRCCVCVCVCVITWNTPASLAVTRQDRHSYAHLLQVLLGGKPNPSLFTCCFSGRPRPAGLSCLCPFASNHETFHSVSVASVQTHRAAGSLQSSRH